MSALSRYFARQSLQGLKLSDSLRRHSESLLELAEADHRINVARIHEALFPLSTPGSANTQLKRLLDQINTAAKAQGVSLRAEITADKKGGAKGRWVWFEGALAAPAPAYAAELAAIPAGQLVTDQRGLPEGEAPVVVLLTFNPHETAAVLRRFHPQGQPRTDTHDGITYNLLGRLGGMDIVHSVSRQGEGEAQNATHDAIKDWRPRAILGVGIAFGVNPAKQAIGDVLVSENLRGYELGRVNADGTITPRGDKPPASPTLLQRFNHLDQSCRADANACTHWPTVRFGTLLSGNKLVDNIDYRTSLLELETEAIGGEMEAVGIQLAADRRKVDWLIVKAICDWGDGNKNAKTKEADQRLAAEHAALVVYRGLEAGGLHQPSVSSPARPPVRPLPPHARLMNLLDREAITQHCLIEDTHGRLASLDKDDPAQPGGRPDEEGVAVLDHLSRWIDDPAAPPLFALLGEYGMGKTVTCQRLVQGLEERRRDDPTRPLPLYFDLRHLTGLDRRVPTLKEAVEECMARGWLSSGATGDYSLENLHRWIEPGAVVLFDGLDEVLVKLKEADGQVFTRELLKLGVEAEARRRAQGSNAPPLKLLISCRTQYFRTLRDQQNHFTGQERGAHRADAYRALVLLPLDEAQVRRYLEHALPGADPERLLETIRAVHNLEELTRRPYTLKLVADFIPDLERERLAGHTVYGVTLYRRMAQRWLERDAGKHHIRPEHKLRLAAHLAAHLWQGGAGLLPAGEIEAWFHAWLESEPDLRRRYAGLHPDQLEEDLRTATFLARQDDKDGSSFRFAHTSLLEFFLADYLLHAVRDRAPERWAMQRTSPETLDFLGQMLAEADDPALLQTLQAWRTPYKARSSELLLAYALRAREKGWPAPLLRGIALAGAELSEQVFAGSAEAPLDLGQADFGGANLRRTVFDQVRLEGASFRGAQLAQASFLDCDARAADWRGAECTATVWRHTRLAEARWEGATGHRPEFLACPGSPDLTPAARPSPGCAFRSPQVAPCAESLPIITGTGSHGAGLYLLSGHRGGVTACAWSPDGAWLASAGDDGTLRLWDAASGMALLSLAGHRGWVWACAWSPDGAWLVSAGLDGTLRLWDASSGAALLTLIGHERGVWACAWSPDSARFVSAGGDGTLRLWDAASGAALLSLVGHKGQVTACAWSPDGAWLVSAGEDGTLRLWDAASGAALLTLTGHEGEVNACAWSPDGARLASAGADGTLRLWDAASGVALLTLTGHRGRVLACAWSPDGSRLTSAGTDGTLRLWDAASGAAQLSLAGHKGGVTACAWSPDGMQIASAGIDGTLRLWGAASGAALLSLSGHKDWVTACAWSPDGMQIASTEVNGTLRLWDADSGAALVSLARHEGGLTACAWSPDGTQLASAGRDGTLRLWDAASGTALFSLSEQWAWVSTCAWSPDGTRLASAGGGGTLWLWDTASGVALFIREGHEGWVNSCAWSPDGTRLASAGQDGTLRLWDAASGADPLILTGHLYGVNSCAWSPDGSCLASAGSDSTLRLWDASDGTALLTLAGHEGMLSSCAWSPDGTRIASAGQDGTLRLWDAASGAALLTLVGHAGGVTACSWSPDGARIASAGMDGTLRLWDAASGKPLRIHALARPDHRGYVGHAVWEPETNRIVEACGDIWRDLAWVRPGPDGWPERLPLEAFGPLPEPQRLVRVGTTP